jgi:hypothetical protein
MVTVILIYYCHIPIDLAAICKNFAILRTTFVQAYNIISWRTYELFTKYEINMEKRFWIVASGPIQLNTETTAILFLGPCLQIRYQIFRQVVGLERGPLSLVSIAEEVVGRNSSGSCLENREYGHRDSLRWLRTRYLLFVKAWTNFADKWRSLGQYSSLADYGHGVMLPEQWVTQYGKAPDDQKGRIWCRNQGSCINN